MLFSTFLSTPTFGSKLIDGDKQPRIRPESLELTVQKSFPIFSKTGQIQCQSTSFSPFTFSQYTVPVKTRTSIPDIFVHLRKQRTHFNSWERPGCLARINP